MYSLPVVLFAWVLVNSQLKSLMALVVIGELKRSYSTSVLCSSSCFHSSLFFCHLSSSSISNLLRSSCLLCHLSSSASSLHLISLRLFSSSISACLRLSFSSLSLASSSLFCFSLRFFSSSCLVLVRSILIGGGGDPVEKVNSSSLS